MTPLKVAMIAAISLVSLAACGGGVTPTRAPGTAGASLPAASTPATAAPATSGATPAPVADLCSALTPAELNAATGRDDYDPGTLDTVGQCLWNTGGATTNQGSLIIAYINNGITLDFIKQSFGSGGVDATVNGHAAFYNPTQGLGSMWVDIGGGRVFVLSFPRSQNLDPSYAQIAQHLAEIAVGRL